MKRAMSTLTRRLSFVKKRSSNMNVLLQKVIETKIEEHRVTYQDTMNVITGSEDVVKRRRFS